MSEIVLMINMREKETKKIAQAENKEQHDRNKSNRINNHITSVILYNIT